MTETAEAAEVRRVLRERGHEVPDRGKLSASNLELYNQLIGNDAGIGPGAFDNRPEADDGPALEDIDIPAGALADEPAPREERPVTPETRPRAASSRGQSPRGRRFSIGGRRAKQPRKRAKRRPAHDWVPTAPVIERVWGEFGGALRRYPPLQRLMAAQAPMVGIVLQDSVRDTLFDRSVVQPVARAEERFEGVNATVMPLLWMAGIVRFGGFDVEPVLTPDGHPIIKDGQTLMRPVIDPATGQPAWNDRTRFMIGGVRSGLISWLKISRRNAADIIERAEEYDELGRQADALISFFLAPPKPKESYADMQREARARTTDFLRADRDGQGDEPAAEPGTAATPARATPGQAPPPPPAAPASMQPDPRTMSFMPPDAAVASQVVPRAPMAQA